jgi:hypothetical protein
MSGSGQGSLGCVERRDTAPPRSVMNSRRLISLPVRTSFPLGRKATTSRLGGVEAEARLGMPGSGAPQWSSHSLACWTARPLLPTAPLHT